MPAGMLIFANLYFDCQTALRQYLERQKPILVYGRTVSGWLAVFRTGFLDILIVCLVVG